MRPRAHRRALRTVRARPRPGATRATIRANGRDCHFDRWLRSVIPRLRFEPNFLIPARPMRFEPASIGFDFDGIALISTPAQLALQR
jgi:hypothetical protein